MSITDPVLEPQVFAPDRRTAYGPIVSAFEVEYHIALSVRRWIRDYLAEAERQRGTPVGRLPEFRSYVVSGALETFPEDQLPALVIASPGTEATAAANVRSADVRGDGMYTFRWRVEATAVISARGNRQAGRLARIYAAYLRALFSQQRLDPERCPLTLRAVDIVSENYTTLLADAERTQVAGSVLLGVEVADVTNRYAGPQEPLLPPTPPELEPPFMEWPEAETAEVTVDKQED